MPKVNSLIFGFFVGFVVFSTSFGLLYLINELIKWYLDIPFLLSIRLLMTLALGINIFPYHYYDNRKAEYTTRGILLFIFLVAMFMVYQFFWPETL